MIYFLLFTSSLSLGFVAGAAWAAYWQRMTFPLDEAPTWRRMAIPMDEEPKANNVIPFRRRNNG